jgi:integrase
VRLPGVRKLYAYRDDVRRLIAEQTSTEEKRDCNPHLDSVSSAFIVKRQTQSGPRWHVRYRLGGREAPLKQTGSFERERDARGRRDFVLSELAAGRDPQASLAMLVEQPQRQTLSEWGVAYANSRVDYAEQTRKNVDSHLKAIMNVLGDRDPAHLTPADVQEWIAGLELKPSSVRRYIATLRALLDFAGVEPNPARDERVRLPREERVVVHPPSAAEVDAIIARSPPRWRLPLRVLEQTGMRIGELTALSWGDVDEQRSRFRVESGKTASARRFVAVPEWLMSEVSQTVPREDRTPERRVFPGLTVDVAGNVMWRACKAVGIPNYSPHDLRHRYASVQIARGIPVTKVAAQLGHSRNSMTLDVYSHVLLDDE